ncbi:MAG: hypothetical protein AB7K71_01705 [Polyangiaceae bacterium]
MSNTRYQRLIPKAIAALSLLLLSVASAKALASHFDLKTAGRGSQPIVTKELSKPAALSGFTLRFSSADDHEIRSLGVLQYPGKAVVGLADQGGEDPFHFNGSYQRLSTSEIHQAARNDCRGPCAIPIHAETDKVFVLAGFEVKNRRGEDTNVRQLAVIPELAAGRVKVIFRDNGVFDYTTRVQYLLLPKSAVYAEMVYNATHTLRMVRRRLPNTHVLQAFSFRFDNGDHHLSNIGVATRDKIYFGFGDKNADDPFHAEAHFAVLR